MSNGSNDPAQNFVGTWEVKGGNIRDGSDRDCPDPKRQYAIIERVGNSRNFVLYSRVGDDGPRHKHQELIYQPKTKTLENKPGERERCIAFWDRKRNGASRNSIFAKRIAKQDGPDSSYASKLLPWERGPGGKLIDDGDGAWGAEGG